MKHAFASLVAAILTPVVIMSAVFSTDLAKSFMDKASIADALVEASELENIKDTSKKARLLPKLISSFTKNENIKTTYNQLDPKSSHIKVIDSKNFIFGKLYDKEQVQLNYELGSKRMDKSLESSDYVFALAFTKASTDIAVSSTKKICNKSTKDLIDYGLCNPPAGKPYTIDAYQTLIAYLIKLAKQQDPSNQSYFGFIPFSAGVQVKGKDLPDLKDAFPDANYVVWPIDFFNFGYDEGFTNLDEFSAYYPLKYLGYDFLKRGVRSNESFSIIPSLQEINQSKLANALSDEIVREFILSHFNIDNHKDKDFYDKAKKILELSFETTEPPGAFDPSDLSGKEQDIKKGDGIFINVTNTLDAMLNGKDVLTYRLFNPKYDSVTLNMDQGQLRQKLMLKNELNNKLASIAAIKDVINIVPNVVPDPPKESPKPDENKPDKDTSSSGGGSSEGSSQGGSGSGGSTGSNTGGSSSSGGSTGGGSGSGGGGAAIEIDYVKLKSDIENCANDKYNYGESFGDYCKAQAADANASLNSIANDELDDGYCYFESDDASLDRMIELFKSGDEAFIAGLTDCDFKIPGVSTEAKEPESKPALKIEDLDTTQQNNFRNQLGACHDDNYENASHSFTKFCLAALANDGGKYDAYQEFQPSNEWGVCYFDDTSNKFRDLFANDYLAGKDYAIAALKDCPYASKYLPSSSQATQPDNEPQEPAKPSAGQIAATIDWDTNKSEIENDLERCLVDDHKKGTLAFNLCEQMVAAGVEGAYDYDGESCYIEFEALSNVIDKLKEGSNDYANLVLNCDGIKEKFEEKGYVSNDSSSTITPPPAPEPEPAPSLEITGSLRTELDNALYNCRYGDPDIYEGSYFYDFCVAANAGEGIMAKYKSFEPYIDTNEGRKYCFFSKFDGLSESLIYDLQDGYEHAKKVFNGCKDTKAVLSSHNISFYSGSAVAAASNAYIDSLKDYVNSQEESNTSELIKQTQDALDSDRLGKLAYSNCDGFVQVGEIKSDWSKEQCDTYRSSIDAYKALLDRLAELKRKKQQEDAANSAKKQPTLDLIDELGSLGANDYSSTQAELERLYTETKSELESLNDELEGALDISGMGLCNSFATYIQGSSCQQISGRDLKFFETPLRKISGISEIKQIPMLNEPAFDIDIDKETKQRSYIANIGAAHEHASIGLVRAYKYLTQANTPNKRAKIFIFSNGSNEQSDGVLVDAGICKMIKENLARQGKETEIIVVGLGYARSKFSPKEVSLDKFKRIWDKCDAKVITADTIDEILKRLSEDIFDNRSMYYYN